MNLNLAAPSEDPTRVSECNDIWDQLPASKKVRLRPNEHRRIVGFEPNHEGRRADAAAAVNGFTTVRNGIVTAAPPLSKLRALNINMNNTAIEPLLDMDSIGASRER